MDKPEKGQLPDEYWNILVQKQNVLIKDMDPRVIAQSLLTARVITDEDLHIIETKYKSKGKHESAGVLLDIVRNSGSSGRSYPIFLKCLEDTGYSPLVVELTDASTSSSVHVGISPAEARSLNEILYILDNKGDKIINNLDLSILGEVLVSKRVIPYQDKDRIITIHNNSGRYDSAKKFLNLYRNSTKLELTFPTFLACLKDKGYHDLATDLEDTIVPVITLPYSWIDELDESKKKYKLLEKNLLEIAYCIDSKDFESIMTLLGISATVLSHIKTDNKDNTVMQIYKAFIKWKQMQASNATCIVLLSALRKCVEMKGRQENDCTDWEKLKTVILKL